MGESLNPEEVSSTFERRSGAPAPNFSDKQQRFVLYSISHAQSPPVASDPSNPAIRIYGTFYTQKLALAHAAKVTASDLGTSLMLGEAHKWTLATTSTHLALDAQYVKEKTARMLKRAAVEREVSLARFDQHREELRKATIVEEEKECGGLDEFEIVDPTDAEQPAEGEEEGGLVSPPLSSDCKLANQDVVCVSFLLEKDSPTPEFLFYVYTTCKNEEDADAYVRNTASQRVKDHDIDVCDVCEWVFPFSDKKAKKIYRDQRLNDFMNREEQ